MRKSLRLAALASATVFLVAACGSSSPGHRGARHRSPRGDA
jgi:hypothetical protein